MSASPARRGWPIGLVALVVLVVLAIGGIIYGATNRPDFDVFLYDAGPIEDYEDGEVRYLPQVNVYVVVLDDDGAAKQLRALDGIAPATGCSIRLNADDARGSDRNPEGQPGSFSDPCSPAVWYLTGDALERSSNPLRDFHITKPLPVDAAGRRIVEVEVIGRPNPAEQEIQR